MNENEMEILFTNNEIEIGGEVIAVKPYSWAKSIYAIRPIGVLVKLFVDHADGMQTAYKAYKDSMTAAQGNLSTIEIMRIFQSELDVLSQEGELEELIDAATSLVRLSVNKPREYIEALPPMDMVALAAAVYKANKDFFGKRLAATEKKTPSSETAKQ